MRARFNFTIRDWIWFCAVFALAVGWGAHFRHSRWVEDNMIGNPPTVFLTDHAAIELRERIQQLEAESETQIDKLKTDKSAIIYAINSVCTEEQRSEINIIMADYVHKLRDMPRR